MPFGLKGGPATFQANVHFYLRELLGKGVVAYLDDVLVYSKTFEEHMVLLGKVFKLLQTHCFFPKLSKCHFALHKIDYLGYHVSATGVSPQSTYIEAVEKWREKLSGVHDVRRFLGVMNYCRMFMGPEYAALAEQQLSKHLSKRLREFTLVQVPDPLQPYPLYSDASGVAVGAVLEEGGKPVAFFSKQLTPVEQRYSVHDQELLALVRTLEKWRHFLLCANVTASDHLALTYLKRLKGN